MDCIAVVGTGSIAKRHLSNLKLLHPESRILAVSASGKNKSVPLNADALVDLDELILNKPDYVIIASPASHHVSVANKLLSHNIAVLIEKPVAHTNESCNELLTYCSAEVTPAVYVGYCLRFLPSALVVKDYLDKNLLGRLYNVESNVGQYLPGWRSDKDYKESVSVKKELGGGVLLELSHELDYLLWILGDLNLQHSWLRTTDELGLEVEEIADLVLTNAQGLYITLHLDFIQKSTQRNCEFIGEKGRLVWDLIGNSVTLYNATGAEILYSCPEYNKNGMYIDMLKAFENIKVASISHLATVETSAKVVKLIEEAKQSNQWRRMA